MFEYLNKKTSIFVILIIIHVISCYLFVYTDYLYAHVTQSENGFVKIYWNLNGRDQEDPMLIQRLRNEILIPPGPHTNQKLNLSQKIGLIQLNGQFNQVPQVEKVLGLSMATPTSGFFIEAGAADGEYISNTLYFEVVHGWHGLLVEPNPDLLSRLVTKHRNAWILPHCLSTKRQVEVVQFDVSELVSGILVEGRTKPSRVDRPNRPKADYERTIEVQCFPLYSVLMALDNPHVDYFSLDIEGAEALVLQTLPWNRINVTLLTVEVNHAGVIFPGNSEDIQKFMKGQGYDHLGKIHIDDVFYLANLNRFAQN